MKSALQTQFPLVAPRLCRLLDAHCVRDRAGLDEDDALMLAKMDVGFDISGADATRMMELRVLPAVVENYLANGARPLKWEWQRVCDEILKGASVKEICGVRFIEGTTVQQILNCSSKHVMQLVDCGQLKKVKGTNHSTGPNGTPKITVDSFLEFLRKRRVR